eukprot:403863-Rhodomonas_salina.1
MARAPHRALQWRRAGGAVAAEVGSLCAKSTAKDRAPGTDCPGKVFDLAVPGTELLLLGEIKHTAA